MAKDPKLLAFLKAREDTEENLEALQINLTRSVDAGMPDMDNAYYNALLTLIDQTADCESWDDLGEVIERAKILETDIDAWLSSHGETTISLPWPPSGLA
jgi:hypothetical protein